MISRILAFCATLAIASAPLTAQAAPNSYGGYDIIGASADHETPYGTTRGWTVSAAFDNGVFAFCSGQYFDSSYHVVIGWDALQWQLAVPVRSNPDWQGNLWVDGRGHGNGGGAQISGTAIGDWTIAWLGAAERDGLAQGNTATLGVGIARYDFPLRGSAAAILMIQECVSRAGARPAPGGQAAAPASPTTPSTPSTPPPSQNGGTATCSGTVFQPYRCKIVTHPTEPGYRDVIEAIDPSGYNPNFFVKVRNDGTGEVWVSYNRGDNWNYLGFWRPEVPNGDCIVPILDGSVRQHPDAINNLGQDAWNLCIH